MLLIGVAGTELSAQERDWLQHDAVAGVVLFKRNFCLAHAGGRVVGRHPRRGAAPAIDLRGPGRRPGAALSRGLQRLGAAAELWRAVCHRPEGALAQARAHAQLMASEVRASGVDLSFAPVVDLARGNRAIGDRAFSDDPQVVASFTRAYVQALHAAGMGATLKHFPGHGTVLEDTHVDHASDPRPLDVLLAEDLVPFVAGIDAGADAVMMAHVVYPQVAPEPAGYASRWIEQILRGQLGFRGVVFSDDIGMAASFSAGGVAGRVHAHLDAGCDVVLVCHPELVAESLQAVAGRTLNTAALIGLIGRGALGWDGLLADAPTTSLSASFGTLA